MLKVTVFTYVYIDEANGRLPLFEECLQSVAAQGYENYEHVIVDDGSKIDLAPIVAGYPKTRLLKKPGTGIVASSYTFQLGLQISKGDVCILLPSDDLSIPGGIGAMVETFEQNPQVAAVIARARYESPGQDDTVWVPDPEFIKKEIWSRNVINGCAIMWRLDSKVMDMLAPNYIGFVGDYDIFGLVATMEELAYCDAEVVRYRWAADSTRNKTKSRVLASARKEDSLFYQYSKPARLEFVRMRLRRASLREYELAGEFKLPTLGTEISDRLRRNLTVLLRNRKWDEAQDLVLEHVDGARPAYADLCAAIEQKKTCYIPAMNDVSLTFMQNVRNEAFFDVVWEEGASTWEFDYMPLPAIRRFIAADGTERRALMSYLGYAT